MTAPAMTLIWTALPAGIRRVGGIWRARVSVFLTPRLEVPAGESRPLAAFSLFEDWPATLAGEGDGGIGFDLQMFDGRGIAAEAHLRPPSAGSGNAAPESAAWRAIFPESTLVRPFGAPQALSAAPPVRFYSAGHVVTLIRESYSSALSRELGLDASPLRSASPGGGNLLQAFVDFHRAEKREGWTGPAGDGRADFHQMVAALGTHPHLMRKVGLVLDLESPAADLGLETPGRHLRIRVLPTGVDFEGATHMCPWTAVEVDTAGGDTFRVFTSLHQEGGGQAGLFALGGGETAIAQEKLEHAAFVWMQHRSADPGAPLPALLQGGMRVTRAGTPQMLAQAVFKQSRLERTLASRKNGMRSGMLSGPPDEDPLFAEQLTRGYRIDVRDVESGRWRSLCRRLAAYRAGGWRWPPVGSVEEEGVVEPAAAGAPAALRATEDLFEWDGWSLVVPRPDSAPGDADPEPDPGAAASGSPLRSRFTVPPGSLQPQRFGSCYQFRARSVDLAGNSLSAAEADQIAPGLPMEMLATRPVCCLRVESAKPPVILRAQARGAGESGDMIVLRDAESPAERTRSVRVHLLPPAVSLDMAEKHGIFDRMTASASWRLIRSHRGRIRFESAEGAGDSEPAPAGDTVREPWPAREVYAPYLPDPMVRQAVLVLPGGAGRVDLPAFDDLPWGEKGQRLARSCSLVVRPGGDYVTASVADRQATLTVPRGAVVDVRIAARLTAADLAIAAPAHPDWRSAPLREGADAGAFRKALTQAAAAGSVPVLAPSRLLRIVHATQCPLSDPAFGRLRILPRPPDATTAILADDAFTFHQPSTGRIDLYANWEDIVDDPIDADEPGWRTVENEMHAGGVRIDADDGNPLDPAEPEDSDPPDASPFSHDFGDTRHHVVTYRAVGTSRFVAFYPPSLTGDADNVTRSSRSVTLHVPSTAPPAPPDIAYVIPTFRRRDSTPVAEGADTACRTAQTGAGLRVYLNRGWFSSGAGERLALVVAAQDTPESRLAEVSVWGMNPLRDSAPLPGPLRMAHVWGGEERFDAWPLGEGRIGLVVHEVRFSAAHGLPFADIVFLSQRAFMPVVRLALARYQAHAIPGCRLSRIVHADFVPLAPGRAVTLRKTGPGSWHLAMRGYSYGRTGGTSIVQAQVEYMEKDRKEDAAGWRPLGPAVLLKPDATAPWRYLWSGVVRIADLNILSERWRRRLVIQEFEPFEAEGGADVPLSDRSRLISAHAVPI